MINADGYLSPTGILVFLIAWGVGLFFEAVTISVDGVPAWFGHPRTIGHILGMLWIWPIVAIWTVGCAIWRAGAWVCTRPLPRDQAEVELTLCVMCAVAWAAIVLVAAVQVAR